MGAAFTLNPVPQEDLFKNALIFDGFAVDDVGDGLDALRRVDERPPGTSGVGA